MKLSSDPPGLLESLVKWKKVFFLRFGSERSIINFGGKVTFYKNGSLRIWKCVLKMRLCDHSLPFGDTIALWQLRPFYSPMNGMATVRCSRLPKSLLFAQGRSYGNNGELGELSVSKPQTWACSISRALCASQRLVFQESIEMTPLYNTQQPLQLFSGQCNY